jgi:hypothetical protein
MTGPANAQTTRLDTIRSKVDNARTLNGQQKVPNLTVNDMDFLFAVLDAYEQTIYESTHEAVIEAHECRHAFGIIPDGRSLKEQLLEIAHRLTNDTERLNWMDMWCAKARRYVVGGKWSLRLMADDRENKQMMPGHGTLREAIDAARNVHNRLTK